MNSFNLLLEYFREITDSEFMTTYKYSNSSYIRKYLGLSQAKNLIQILLFLNNYDKIKFKDFIKKLLDKNNLINIILLLEKYFRFKNLMEI